MAQERIIESCIARSKSSKKNSAILGSPEKLTGRAAIMNPSPKFAAASNREKAHKCLGCKREFPNKKKCDAHMQWCKHVAGMTHGKELGVRLLFKESHAQKKKKKKGAKPDNDVRKSSSLTRSREDGHDRSGDTAVERGAAILERAFSNVGDSPGPASPAGRYGRNRAYPEEDEEEEEEEKAFILETAELKKLWRRKTCIDAHTGLFVVVGVLGTPFILALSDSGPFVAFWMVLVVLWCILTVVLVCYRRRVVEAARVESGELDNEDEDNHALIGIISPNQRLPTEEP